MKRITHWPAPPTPAWRPTLEYVCPVFLQVLPVIHGPLYILKGKGGGRMKYDRRSVFDHVREVCVLLYSMPKSTFYYESEDILRKWGQDVVLGLELGLG